MKKVVTIILVVSIILSLSMLTISCKQEDKGTETATTEAEEKVTETAEEETKEVEEAEETEELKLAIIGVQHPYFEPWRQVAIDYEVATGIEVEHRATANFDQEEENVEIEGLVTLGYNAFALWPGHPVAVNATITELLEKGIPVILIAGGCELPTDAKFTIATDVKASAMKATENLIEAMGGKGNIANLLGALADPNTLLRKEGIEAVVAKYPDVQIVDEVADIDAFEAATTKIDALLAARADEIDGMVATAYVPTVVGSEALTQIGDKRIKFVGIDDDIIALTAIREGYITGVMSQSPYGQGYVALEVLRLLKQGYTPKDGVHFIDSGSFLINIDNVDTYKDIIVEEAMEMLEIFAEKYMDPPQ